MIFPMTKKTIRVQGRGSVCQAPDQIRLKFTLDHSHPDFQKAVEGCNQRVAVVKAAATGSGIAPEVLKTIHFDVREETEYQGGRHRHVGFEASHQLAVVLPVDRDLVGRFLSAVMSGGSKPQVNLAFEVSDAEELKQKVLANAVENARRRADTIASAAGVKLGAILQIEYGYSEVRISSRDCDMDGTSSSVACDAPDFNPDDVEAEDTVTVTWEIAA